MRRILKAWKNEKGLTLVELLAVVVILGIIAAIAVPSVGGLIENSKRDAHLANAQQMINSAKLVAVSELSGRGNGTFYVTLDYLVDQGYIDPVEDPFSGTMYTSITTNNSTDILNFVPGDARNGAFIEITKTGNSFVYTVTLNSSNTEFNITDQPENNLTREAAFN
ncbi:type IV pilus assembly protein PilA [Bacillus oleivorans]|uniref:Type IV pilus assembly protein PilA n=1 Tax=Bacillus oleivorans TaxID=1448271 RepID=A0A285CWX9_9BACI|nr:prepilin-type N-terminal cleavage/methylation domain-containing protein [Bacillus oleivorans]SNX71546.1 type IV pilus assembly protein PilA [Bacillus oleivorans]